MDRSDVGMAQTRVFPTNVVTFRFACHGAFKGCFVHSVGYLPFTLVLHQGRFYIVSSSHVKNDAVQSAQLPCAIYSLAMRYPTNVDRKPFGGRRPNPDGNPPRPGCSAQDERGHVGGGGGREADKLANWAFIYFTPVASYLAS